LVFILFSALTTELNKKYLNERKLEWRFNSQEQ
jgi:hypothetical protein